MVLDPTLRLSSEIPPLGFCSEGRSPSGMHVSCIRAVVRNLARTARGEGQVRVVVLPAPGSCGGLPPLHHCCSGSGNGLGFDGL